MNLTFAVVNKVQYSLINLLLYFDQMVDPVQLFLNAQGQVVLLLQEHCRGQAETQVGQAETQVGQAETQVGQAETQVGQAETQVCQVHYTLSS